MRRIALLTSLATATAVCAGCNHIDTKVPGVLDMRSDGAGLAVAESLQVRPRDGLDSFVAGSGITDTAGTVSVDDRQHHVLSLFPVMNDNAAEEIRICTENAALRDVTIGDSHTGGDALWLLAGFVVNFVPVVGTIGYVVMDAGLAPWTATFSGTRVESPNGGAQ
jgi:hypothetical protein